GPMPSKPFSVWRMISRSTGRQLATIVGRPMPRLTYAPFGMSRATRAAICSFVNRCMSLGCGASRRHRLRGWRNLDHARDEDARGHDGFGIEVAEFHHLTHLGDGARSGGCHDRAEVAGG